MINSNIGPILHCFGDMVTYWLENAYFPYPLSFTTFAQGEPYVIYEKSLQIWN